MTFFKKTFTFFYFCLFACVPLAAMETSPKNNTVVLWGLNDVIFKAEMPKFLEWTFKVLGVTEQTFVNKLYADLKDIPATAIIDETTGQPYVVPAHIHNLQEPSLLVAWITGHVSNEQAKRLALEHTKRISIARCVANAMFKPEELAKKFHPNQAVLRVVQQCRQQNSVGLCSSFNGEAFDTLVDVHPFLRTIFDNKCEFISGKQGFDTSDTVFYDKMAEKLPELYDKVVEKFQDKHIYLVDAPGPALGVAQKKGINAIEFITRKNHAIEDLSETLRDEGVLK